ncbi:MAG: hypothetical protein NTY48_05440 [Candidatus Diapherotrites archaeon]|nr:hypothetical protein [Candidatus Diapherotrites archaeon]
MTRIPQAGFPRARIGTGFASSYHAWKKRTKQRSFPISKNIRKGIIIYDATKIEGSLPKPIRVSKTIEPFGQRKAFTMSNVEWISINPRRKIASSQISDIFIGKVKFAGKRSAQFAVIKRLNKGIREKLLQMKGGNYEEVIARLSKSKVLHPKMAFFKTINDGVETEYLIQEPFIFGNTSGKNTSKYGSKFTEKNTFFSSINLSEVHYQKRVVEMIKQTALLAQAGLSYREVGVVQRTVFPDWSGHLMPSGKLIIDVFNGIKPKNSSLGERIYVQDIDFLKPEDNSVTAWNRSVTSIVAAFRNSRTLQSREGLDFLFSALKEAGEKYHFPVNYNYI